MFEIVPTGNCANAPLVGTKIVYLRVALIEAATPVALNCVLNCDAPESPAIIDTMSVEERLVRVIGDFVPLVLVAPVVVAA